MVHRVIGTTIALATAAAMATAQEQSGNCNFFILFFFIQDNLCIFVRKRKEKLMYICTYIIEKSKVAGQMQFTKRKYYL